ncbi:MAG: lanthionine synthetase LanC family protein [Parafilimonas sp.]
MWAAEDGYINTINTALYAGSAGVVLFCLEAYHRSGDKKQLQLATEAADFLANTLPDNLDTTNDESGGLYTGIAGIGFALSETYKIIKEEKYRIAFLQCIRLLQNALTAEGDKIHYGSSTDIISGNAGIGLFWLYAYNETGDDKLKQTAAQTGNWLIAKGIADSAGFAWKINDDMKIELPNFSHGTAGVSYFLSKLFETTKEKKFLDAALAGGHYLQSIKAENEMICHNTGSTGKDLFYVSWCHGPPGTARLYYQLWQLTKDEKWKNAILKMASSLMEIGIPEKRTPGYWNNISQCCGNAGIAEFYLSMYKIFGDKKYVSFADKMINDILQRSTSATATVKWIQAENRTQSGNLKTQTGYMQGAAGVGMLLLHRQAIDAGKQPQIRFPDAPY